jgi:hypothetical protein
VQAAFSRAEWQAVGLPHSPSGDRERDLGVHRTEWRECRLVAFCLAFSNVASIGNGPQPKCAQANLLPFKSAALLIGESFLPISDTQSRRTLDAPSRKLTDQIFRPSNDRLSFQLARACLLRSVKLAQKGVSPQIYNDEHSSSRKKTVSSRNDKIVEIISSSVCTFKIPFH